MKTFDGTKWKNLLIPTVVPNSRFPMRLINVMYMESDQANDNVVPLNFMAVDLNDIKKNVDSNVVLNHAVKYL